MDGLLCWLKLYLQKRCLQELRPDPYHSELHALLILCRSFEQPVEPRPER